MACTMVESSTPMGRFYSSAPAAKSHPRPATVWPRFSFGGENRMRTNALITRGSRSTAASPRRQATGGGHL
jgi:hypothetical protein